jgi:hypothetical protein
MLNNSSPSLFKDGVCAKRKKNVWEKLMFFLKSKEMPGVKQRTLTVLWTCRNVTFCC